MTMNKTSLSSLMFISLKMTPQQSKDHFVGVGIVIEDVLGGKERVVSKMSGFRVCYKWKRKYFIYNAAQKIKNKQTMKETGAFKNFQSNQLLDWAKSSQVYTFFSANSFRNIIILKYNKSVERAQLQQKFLLLLSSKDTAHSDEQNAKGQGWR